MELILNRPLQWFVCQLHANELPLRHFFAHVDGTTTGPGSLTGEIRKSLSGCEKLPVVSSTPIEYTQYEVTKKKDLTDDRNHTRELALRRILKAHKVKRSAATTAIVSNNIRIFNLSAFDLCAMDYVDLIKWESATERPLTERFSDDMISEIIVNPAIIQEAILPAIKVFLCHPQATEQIVNVVTEAAAAVC
ncbi:hypothetical protein AVEN_43551-1 [Araneus ventricosus]|uniref:Uncharacterized protein n=1 Tax=Araneus ventricosus TaxID=182803 RepID=A0A4Y2EJ59_ARAVE|nr:hypothetical protein AVEN_43551-1 [Araneus ventricosus]